MKPTTIIFALIPFTLGLPSNPQVLEENKVACKALATLIYELDHRIVTVNFEELQEKTAFLHWDTDCEFEDKSKECQLKRNLENEYLVEVLDGANSDTDHVRETCSEFAETLDCSKDEFEKAP